jgi:hypothetical protein
MYIYIYIYIHTHTHTHTQTHTHTHRNSSTYLQDRAFPVYTVKEYRRCKYIALFSLHLGSGLSPVRRPRPLNQRGQISLYPLNWRGGGDPQSDYTFRRKYKSFVSAEIRTPDRLSRSLVTKLRTLSRSSASSNAGTLLLSQI